MLDEMVSGHVSTDHLNELAKLSGKEKERKQASDCLFFDFSFRVLTERLILQRLLISEMPEAVLLPKIRDVLQDPLVGPDNVRRILRMDKMNQLYKSDVQPQQESVLLR